MTLDLPLALLKRSLRSGDTEHGTCSCCRRTPLTGERVHLFESGRRLCELCLAGLPEERRRPLRSELVHASERHVAVLPRAA